jgi:hypothetical protein
VLHVRRGIMSRDPGTGRIAPLAHRAKALGDWRII